MKPAVDRRSFLKLSGCATLSSALSRALAQDARADYTLRIANSRIELAPGHTITTKAYNGQFPGPLIRLTEGREVVVDVFNDTDVPEQFHWHGQTLPVDVDGAAEEGTPYVGFMALLDYE